jgi:AGCS family alanine or glycine:cation symporter
MYESFVSFLNTVDAIYWRLGMLMIIFPGLVLTVRTHFFQFKILTRLKICVKDLQECNQKGERGVHPLRLYFASIGGMIGIGNVVGVVTALIIGGPGSLFWLWVSIFLGMLIKYSEIYLGVKFRKMNQDGCYDGGPMYFLQEAFHNKYIPNIVAFLLCIYGVEIFQFVTITDTLQMSFGVNRYLIVFSLLTLIMWTALGGVKRLSNLCAFLMPPFIISYTVMCLWIIGHHLVDLPSILYTVFESAFNGHAAVGGFAGAGFILAMQQGIARGVYSGDIGIGFDATILSTTKTKHPERQARMAIFSLLTEGIICTMTLLTVLCSGFWKEFGTAMLPGQYIPKIFADYFPFVDFYIGILFFLAGFTTIIAYYAVGAKTARYLSPKYGFKIYTLYAIAAFICFPYFDQTVSQLLMSICSGFLITFNIAGMMKLRHHIKFS